ncbi:hypothetical protein BU24DRAFT_417367 [Aaosphaeria arxii CBS 175.79]|uniref:Uncharacterized protein n=1 Tax=Aaosphaeria arxii CBS 175.79 TaxID=1450172 RepID=A0A6A5YAX6_9PLEO|nr:uncharacterized protein BU24DRAFT_417367 [Aaosphaeria arxii CBS 175.79]KAF2021744.1 hypothetical protein BU24DRAFT_417367 [Aaosphaeria arxii CBS 175.79]
MQFLQGEKDIDRRSCDKDGTTPRSDLSAELGILMETCDRVIEVVRRAVELLKGLHGNEVKAYLRDSSTTKSYNDNQSNRFRILWIMFAFLAFILFATKHYDNTTKIAQLADKLDHISSHGGGGVEIEDIGAQLRDLSARSDSHGLRLDNLWEAWEAANLDGKYRNSQAPDAAKMQSCSDFEKRLNKFQQDMIQLELEVKEARRHFHLVDIRLMRQLKRFAGREGLELEK